MVKIDHGSQNLPNPVLSICQIVDGDGKKDIVWVSYMDGTVIEANYIAWRDSVNVALFVMSEQIEDITEGADHYYNYNIANPYWVGAMTETVIIGNHRFMKDR